MSVQIKKDKEVKKEKEDFLGHRTRLRQRFRRVGAQGLDEHEVLELILFRAIPRADTKSLAKRLLRIFGSFPAVIGASRDSLLTVEQVGERVADELQLFHEALSLASRHKIMKKNLLGAWQDLFNYCQLHIGYQSIECFHILYLNHKNYLIRDEEQQKGTIDYSAVYPREIVKRALELNASAVVFVHNHPSGQADPSRQDIETTRKLIDMLKNLHIEVLDHIIVARGAITSFQKLNLLRDPIL